MLSRPSRSGHAVAAADRTLPPPQGPPFIGIPPPASLLCPRPDGTVALSPLVVVSVLAQAMLATVVGLLLLASAPRLFGAHPVVITGGSMQPSIRRGDVVIVRSTAATALRPGVVITFADPNRRGSLVTHRVHDVRADGRLVTKGDANRDEDAPPVPLSTVLGRAVLRVPYIGAPVVWVQQRQWYKLIVVAGIVAGLATTATAPARAAHHRRRSARA